MYGYVEQRSISLSEISHAIRHFASDDARPLFAGIWLGDGEATADMAIAELGGLFVIELQLERSSGGRQ